MRSRTHIERWLCVLTVMVTGCNLSTLQVVSPTPSQTPLPSQTPSPAPTITPTIVLDLPTQTPTAEFPGAAPTSGAPSAGDFDCRLLSQSVKNGRHFAPRERFDMGWWVRNTGTLDWDPASIDFVYAGGTKMYASGLNHLQTSVAADARTLLVADMLAPKQTGKYTTIWSLRHGQDYFCQLRLTIYVP
jgi:hypothetical protein